MVRGMIQPPVGQANLGDTAVPNTFVTWLNEFAVNLAATGSQTDPDIMQLAIGDFLVFRVCDNSPGACGGATA
jgi:hypothetical protein